MARGLLIGGLFCSVVALVSFITTAFVPMWLVNRVELENSKCWQGTGIWATNYRFGADILSAGVECHSSSFELMPRSTEDEYCSTTSRHVEKDTAEYRESMCKATNQSKVLAVCTIILSSSSILSSIYGQIGVLRGDQQLWPSAIAVLFSVASFGVGIAVFVIMTTSPLFSLDHFFVLDGDSLVKHKDGMSCTVRVAVPFLNPTLDMPLDCLFPGPSFATALTGIVASLMGSVLFVLKAREIVLQHEQARLATSSTRPLLQSTRNPLEVGYAHEGTGPATPSSGVLDSVWAAVFSPGGRNGLIPERFRHPRRYSMYGACMRRWVRRRKTMAFLLSSLLPVLALFNVVIFAGWALYGTSFGVHVWVGQVPSHSQVPQHVQLLDKDEGVESLLGQVDWKSIAQEFEVMRTDSGADAAEGMHLNFTVDILEYSPIMSWTFFLNIGGYFFLVVQLVACIIWPVIKAIVWFWVWFTPLQESFRGRILTWVDALGKLSLANVYTLALFALVNRWESVVRIQASQLPEIISWPSFDLELKLSMHVSAGFGTYSFAIACVLSMLLGELFVYMHRKCREWEEVRRDQMAHKKRRRPRRPGAAANDVAGSDVDESPSGFQVFDSPFHDVATPATSLDTDPLTFTPGTRGDETPTSMWAHTPTSWLTSVRRSAQQVIFGGAIEGRQVQIHGLGFETLCDRLYEPVPGKKHMFTLRGRLVTTLLLLLSLTLVIAGLVFEMFEFRRVGFVGQYFVTDEYKLSRYSVVRLLHEFSTLAGSEEPTFVFAFSLFVFTLFCSIFHVACLLLVWWVPMRVSTQIHVFHFMEVLSAWSAAEIFILSVVVIWYDVTGITKDVLKGAGFGVVEDIFSDIFPKSRGIYVVEQRLLDGFYLLLFGVILEKLFGHYILELFATSIAERKIKLEVDKSNPRVSRNGPKSRLHSAGYSAPLSRVSLDAIQEEDGEGSQEAVGQSEAGVGQGEASPVLGGQEGQSATVENGQEGDAANSAQHPAQSRARSSSSTRQLARNILREEGMEFFSPAGRYFGASGMQETVYAGQLRGVWRAWEYMGLIREATLHEVRLSTPQLDVMGEQRIGQVARDQVPDVSPYFRLDGDGMY